MPSGLIALLDDVAMIAKLASASIDDVVGATAKAGTKAAGVVIDDTAVTPRYVVGLAPERELPIQPEHAALRLAPPTRAPSTSPIAKISDALQPLTDPP